MTDSELNENRLIIVKEFLETGESLNLSDHVGLTISSSSPGIYHVFSNQEFGKLKFEYSLSDESLKKLVKTLNIRTIKKIFVEGRILRLRNKYLAENDSKSPREFNPLDFENCK